MPRPPCLYLRRQACSAVYNTSNRIYSSSVEKVSSTNSSSHQSPELYRVGDYDKYDPNCLDEIPMSSLNLSDEEVRFNILHPDKKLDNERYRVLHQGAKEAFYHPKTESELAADLAIRSAMEKQLPTRPIVPWEKHLAVPRVYDPLTKSYRQQYPNHMIFPEIDKMMTEIKDYGKGISLKDCDPWYKYYEWTQHEYFSTRNILRHIFPGGSSALAIFTAYCFGEAIYEYYLDNVYYA